MPRFAHAHSALAATGAAVLLLTTAACEPNKAEPVQQAQRPTQPTTDTPPASPTAPTTDTPSTAQPAQPAGPSRPAVQPPAADRTPVGKLTVGEPAPNFTLANIVSGEPVKLADTRGKFVLIKNWVSWCPKCRAASDNFVKPLYDDLASGPDAQLAVVALGMSPGDTLEAQKAIASKYAWTSVFDQDMTVEKQYGILATPSIVILDPDGNVVTYGFLDKKYSKAAAAYLREVAQPASAKPVASAR